MFGQSLKCFSDSRTSPHTPPSMPVIWGLLLLLAPITAFLLDDLDDPLQPTTSCECGWTNRGRIVGGSETGRNEYPFMAVLLRPSDHHQFCGAAVLSPRHLLTAAHCTAGKKPQDILVAVGAHDLAQEDEFTRHLKHVSKIVDHEKYKVGGMEANDISILETKEFIPFSKKIGPVCLPDGPVNLDDQMIKVLGWGLIENDSDKYSSVLREVDLRVIPYSSCRAFWKTELLQPPGRQICTHSKGKDTCQVDSGGPLILLDPEIGRFILRGLVSYGADCGGMQPAVNTDVSYYLPWIKDNLNRLGGQFCQKISA